MPDPLLPRLLALRMAPTIDDRAQVILGDTPPARPVLCVSWGGRQKTAKEEGTDEGVIA